jgi:putative integral membrane protein (TIGR02587 family)
VETKTINLQLREYVRGLGGGLIFGLPMLFTQEIWQQGFLISYARLIFFIIFIYCLLLSYVYFAGFRTEKSISGVAFEAVETLGLAFMLSALILLIIGQINLSFSISENLGKIVLESIPVSIGIAVASEFLGSVSAEEKKRKEEARPGTIGQYIVATGGAVYFAINFAGSEEITRISTEISWLHGLAAVIFSLFVTYQIVFFADFKGVKRRLHFDRILESPKGETAFSYALALIVSLSMLFLTGRVSLLDSVMTIGFQVVILGIPASLGSAAGRLLI